MGASFTNYQVRGKSTSEVINALAPLVETRAYVSPEKEGWVTVYDEASDQQSDKVLNRIAGELSKKLGTEVFAFLVHDSDIAMYWLHQNGILLDEFDSAPEYFKKASNKVLLRVRGNADKLLPLCVAGTTLSQIEEIIHPADPFPIMAEDIVIELAELLGIDEMRVDLGFTYFDDEGEEMLDDASEFSPIGKGALRKEKQPPGEDEGEDEKPSPVTFDTFSIAIGMMTKCWTGEYETMARTFNEKFPNQIINMADELAGGADQAAQNFLKHSHLRGIPEFKELKAARDQGTEALAKLLVQRTPTELGPIADGAIGEGMVKFIGALLANGMDPNTPNQHGESLLSVAESLGKTEIYNLLKSAIEKKS